MDGTGRKKRIEGADGRTDRARNIELLMETKDEDQRAIGLFLEALMENERRQWARRQLSGNSRLVDAAAELEALGVDPVNFLEDQVARLAQAKG